MTADQVQGAVRVGIVAVERRRDQAAIDADQAADQLDGAAAGDEGAHVALERRHRRWAGAEDPVEGPGLGQVADLRCPSRGR